MYHSISYHSLISFFRSNPYVQILKFKAALFHFVYPINNNQFVMCRPIIICNEWFMNLMTFFYGFWFMKMKIYEFMALLFGHSFWRFIIRGLVCIEYDVIFPICCCNPDVFDCFFSFQEAVFTRFVVLVKFACRKNI